MANSCQQTCEVATPSSEQKFVRESARVVDRLREGAGTTTVVLSGTAVCSVDKVTQNKRPH